MSNKTLYERLGGYDAICAVANDLLPRLQSDTRLSRYWQNRGEDGLKREKQLLIDFLHRTGHEDLPQRDEDYGERLVGISWTRQCHP